MLRDYGRDLAEMRNDRMLHEQRVRSMRSNNAPTELLEKYRFYIKDLLERKEDKATKLCLALARLEGRCSLVKALAFQRITRPAIAAEQLNRNDVVRLGCLLQKVQTKSQAVLKTLAFTRITRLSSNADAFYKKLNKLSASFDHILQQNIASTFKDIQLASCHRRIRMQENQIAELQKENTRLHNELVRKPTSNNTTCDQPEYERIMQLDRQLKDKERDIKSLVRANKEAEARYEQRLERLQQQLNKLNHINSRLMEEVEEVRNRRGDISDIAAEPFGDNSLSLELFNQDEKHRELQEQLSDKYLRQVIQLKENLESLKENFLQLLSNPTSRSTLVNLMYLLGLSEEEKREVARLSYLSQLFQ